MMSQTLLSDADQVIKNFKPNQKLDDPFRQCFHITPPQGLLNDPNGFVFHQGRYHLFYQWNPFSCDHSNKFWAHLSSDNLVNWQQHNTALAPDASYDKQGCYSGSGFIVDGKLMLFYTGNVKDQDNQRFSTQCLAEYTPENDSFIKLGPAISEQPEGYTSHFRDPKIWQYQGVWYAVVGGQRSSLQGCVLLYCSLELKDWDFLGELAGSQRHGLDDFGFMWECPDFFELDDQDILLCSPQGLEPQGDKYHNRYQAGYFIGKFDYQTKNYQHGDFKELDRGFEFYAPQTTIDNKGRRLMTAWMGMPEEEDQPTVNYGWLHGLTLTRELKYKNSKLYQYPVEELKQLRSDVVTYNDVPVAKGDSFNDISGNCCEIILNLTDINGLCGIRLCQYDDYYIDISYCPETQRLTFDRNNTENQTGIRACQLNSGANLSLQIFIDRSSIECFVNHGEEVFTSRIFPTQLAEGIQIYSQGSCIINKLLKYYLN
ncbi:sucrose-6-phosphate hydrolase [Vibrio sp. SS-MA-C1-2]|uniref:glycoside hydrolase family 32 protein n=1 Tax=Vibrio sp. SS-MA-C1-2 TaxID=2908646 RepID=UPI001F2799D2|nr:sucrose-6-phosphate hydrolase [Vibrio sp. SS-MA-C1-2]UJF17944.1 sucrose-6-phosphate hydrolase [Vibrio sp. SS-MA-C1-2]